MKITVQVVKLVKYNSCLFQGAKFCEIKYQWHFAVQHYLASVVIIQL